MYLFRKLFGPPKLLGEDVRLETWLVGESTDPGFERPGKMVGRWGKRGAAPGCFNMPSGVVVNSSGDIIVADTENSRIQVFSPTGQLKNIISGKGDAPECLNHPMGVALTPDSEERVIVTDSVNAAVKVFYQSGEFVASFNPRAVDFPYGVAVTYQQHVVVTDVCHHRVVVLYPSGGVRNFFGKYGDDIECLDHPYYIAATKDNEIVISDSGNSRIKITDINGSILRMFNMEDFRLYDEHFVMLHDVTVDEDDNILIIGNYTVYLVASNGRLWEVLLPSDGLDAPRSLAYSPQGQLVVMQYDLDKRHEVTVFLFNKDDFKSLKRLPLKPVNNALSDSQQGSISSVKGTPSPSDATNSGPRQLRRQNEPDSNRGACAKQMLRL